MRRRCAMDEMEEPGSGRMIVLTVVGGGLEHAGGIGRFIGNLKRQHDAGRRRFELVVADSRGAGTIWRAPLHCARVAFRILGLRLSGRLALVHLNLASRGST